MKYIVILGDGMADYPLTELNGKTPLQIANKPNIDYIALKGRNGILRTIPDKMQPGSDVANLSVLGYDPIKYYTGRGPIEAVSLGINLRENETAFRCNLVTLESNKMKDYSAGHIDSEDAKKLIETINKELGTHSIKFYNGISYRHVLVIANNAIEKTECIPPHDITDQNIDPYLPRGEGSKILLELMKKSQEILKNHPINNKRTREGKKPANFIWPWSQGKKPKLQSFKEKFGVEGAIISAVDLIRGIGLLMGLKVIQVPGATGYYNTNYTGKAEQALKTLENKDFIYIHVEAPDEAGHAADIENKIKAIENIDEKIVGKILNEINELTENYKIAILPDHPTPIKVKTHTKDPVPVAIYTNNEKGDKVTKFDEPSAKKGALGLLEGEQFMNLFIKN
ncbi:MAG: cofactor-independent phosphoglycerate mutase [Candidatus Jordarchaeum sp.]|uniref:cofactor-independent phosphoglycerate mutase n=1 Tax=Candidatus Jordarchaeum sp. TaxID=2823881 RepID=UPI0040492B84